jgi:SAM-dependent methyltransferase
MEKLMTETIVTEQHSRESVGRESDRLNRSCPVCGNSSRQRCDCQYKIPAFEVLRCNECGVGFINQLINDNAGFSLEQGTKMDPHLASKAVNDFYRVKARLKGVGVVASRNRRILDVGCGTGAFLWQALQDGWSALGLELSPSLADYARKQRGVEVEIGSIESQTDLPPQSVDVITMFGVIEHLGNPRGAAQECGRLLRPGGFLILQTPSEDGFIRGIGRLLFRATGGFVSFHVKQLYSMGGGHSVCFNRRSIGVLLAQCGFEVLSIDQSTYGLGTLLERFKGMPLYKKLLYSSGTCAVFSLGRILRAYNHMTVYAQKRA